MTQILLLQRQSLPDLGGALRDGGGDISRYFMKHRRTLLTQPSHALCRSPIAAKMESMFYIETAPQFLFFALMFYFKVQISMFAPGFLI